MQKTNTAQKGFTIVELLIVIAVIAILAAVSIVSFSGIQRRAQNTQIKTAAESYVKAFSYYKTLHGSLPPIVASEAGYPDEVCLGSPSDFPAAGGMPAGVCYAHDGMGESVKASQTLQEQLSRESSGLSGGGLPLVQLGEIKIRGLLHYRAANIAAFVIYGLFGDEDCGSASKQYFEDTKTTQCSIQLR